MSIFSKPWVKKSGIVVLALIVIGAGYTHLRGGSETSVTTAMVLHEVQKGPVTTGIQTTGTIKAADILDLNVYKLTKRIDTVGVTNGTHVDEGALLFAFDQSDVAVDISESQLAIKQAQLALDIEQEATVDPNTTITSLENDIAVYTRNLAEYEQDLRTTLRAFLNKNLEAEPSSTRYNEQITKTAPTVGGLHNDTTEGEYRIEVYASNEDSGYSYRLTGLEKGVYPVYADKETPLGTKGLTITFPSTSLTARDEWLVAVPNIYAPEYPQNFEDYTKATENIQESIANDTVTLANKRIQLEQAKRADTTTQRNLNVESAALAIEKARVDLRTSTETQNERRIIAPFSGTIEGIENVVVGATPTNDSNDTIDLGLLISDDFLVTFSLSANDVDTVTLDQKVLVTLTSVPDSEPLTAYVTKISSLPDSSTVAQYEVNARVDLHASSTVRLRDGMLADIEIVQQEKPDTIRVPSVALHYTTGTAYVTIVEGLTAEQEQQFARLGIVRTDTVLPTTYEREVQVGLRGAYYTEIVDGVSEGERVEISENAPTTEGTGVVRTGFGAGGGRPPGETRD